MSTTRFFTTTKAWQIFRPSHCALKLAINSSIYGIDAKAIANTLTDSLYSVWLLQHGYPAVQCEGKKDTANKPLMTSGSNNLTSYPQSPPPPPPHETFKYRTIK